MHNRDGDQEIATGIAHQGLDVPLLVGPADPAEVGLEEVVALESLEGVGERPPPAFGDLGDGDLQVVVADPTRNSAEEGEGPDVTLEEGLGALAWEGPDEDRIGIRQGHDEQGDLGRPAIEMDLGLTEIDLGPARWMGQRDEDLGGSSPGGDDDELDGGQATFVAIFVTEAVEDSDGGVTLLPRGLLVGLEDLMDDGKEGIELGPRPWRGPAVSGRLGVAQNLLECVPVNLELATDGSLALAVDEDATADLGPVLHVCVHP